MISTLNTSSASYPRNAFISYPCTMAGVLSAKRWINLFQTSLFPERMSLVQLPKWLVTYF